MSGLVNERYGQFQIDRLNMLMPFPIMFEENCVTNRS